MATLVFSAVIPLQPGKCPQLNRSGSIADRRNQAVAAPLSVPIAAVGDRRTPSNGCDRSLLPRERTEQFGSYMPQRNAAVWTGESHNDSIESSTAHTVIEQPAISSEVT